jgi:hypothetical protein
MLFISHLERKTTQRLPCPQRKDGLTDGRKDGQTDRQTVGSTSDRKGKNHSSELCCDGCVITLKKKQNPSFQDPRKKHKIDEDDELQGFPANSRHISSSSSSYYYYY